MTVHPERSVADGNQHDELRVERLDPQEISDRDHQGAQQDLADRQSLRRVAGMSTSFKTSPRSSTAGCSWSAWCWLGCGPPAAQPTRSARWPS